MVQTLIEAALCPTWWSLWSSRQFKSIMKVNLGLYLVSSKCSMVLKAKLKADDAHLVVGKSPPQKKHSVHSSELEPLRAQLGNSIPPCLAAWHWRSQSSLPQGQRRTSALGRWPVQGLRGRWALWPELRTHCCGRWEGGVRWLAMPPMPNAPCTRAARECWRGARWERWSRSALRRSRWPGTRSPVPGQWMSDPSPWRRPGSRTHHQDLKHTHGHAVTPLNPWMLSFTTVHFF